MPARIDVYCRNADLRLDCEAMLHVLDDADLMTLAEVLDLPEGEAAAVEAMFGQLRTERAGDTVEVHWKPGGRPIQLDVLRGAEAATQIAELLAELPAPAGDEGAGRVHAHLRRTRSVLLLEMGLADANQLAATIGEVLAFAVAEAEQGLVRLYDRDWVSPSNRAVSLWTVM